MQVDILEGEEVKKQVFVQLATRLHEHAESLPPACKANFLALAPYIIPDLLTAHSVLFAAGLHDRLDLQEPMPAICLKGRALAETVDNDETFRAALLTYEAVGRLIETLSADPSNGQTTIRSAIAGIALGQAEIRIAQVVTGLWDIMAEAEYNSTEAKRMSNNRVAGGKKRGDALKEKAQEWKGRLLPLALALDADHPDWNRQKLAMEVMFRDDTQDVTLRSVEDWLKKEAEQPNGPIMSRARKQAA